MKYFSLSLVFAFGLNAMATTVSLSPDSLECRALTGPTFHDGDVGVATALFYEKQMIYHGYWVTSAPNSATEMIRCKSLIAKAKAAKKDLLMDLDQAADGNEAGASSSGWGEDGHWRQDEFLVIEGTVPPPKCVP